jgi:hypothetical protein
MTFDLHSLVQAELERSKSADPLVVAEGVLDLIPDEALRDVVGQLIRGYVRNEAGRQRSRHLSQAIHPTRVAPSPSSKVAAIRTAWQRVLDDRIHVGGAAYKFLRDCTYEDLQAAANERERLAEANHRSAKQYQLLADLIAQHGVTTFGELPVEILQAALA